MVIFLCLSSHPCSAGKEEMNIQEIRETLNNLKTSRGRIEYLEALDKKEKGHFVLYTLASLYLERGELEKTEALLKEDLKKHKNLFDAYESYSLLIGLYRDQKRIIPEMEIEQYTLFFQKMKRKSEKKSKKKRPVKQEIPTRPGLQTREEEGKEIDWPAVKKGQFIDQDKKIESYGKDPFQFERMIGDYYFSRQNFHKAYKFYHSFYQDMDKPVKSFTPQSMRNYVDTLLKKKKTDDALLFMGYIINLKAYMVNDIFYFAELYYNMGDRISSLLVLMFAHTLTEGHISTLHEKSRSIIDQLYDEMKNLPEAQKIINLTDIYLKGENILNIQLIIDGLKKDNVKNFFFYYLEGVYYFAANEYSEALGRFLEFNGIYPYLADAYYYAMVSMYNLDSEKYSRQIVVFAEKTIELKPDSLVAKMTKMYLGKLLGLTEGESSKLLTPSEIGFILDNFLFHGAPVNSLDKLLASLTISRNPYQIALVQLMSKVNRRREEFVSYLKHVYDLFNEKGKSYIEQILSAMGEPLD
ncbi:hypothetical protein ES703_76653 [subsurface metagenome]